MANGPFWMIISEERTGISNGYADASAETSRMYPQPNCATGNLSAVAVTEKRKSKKPKACSLKSINTTDKSLARLSKEKR